VRTLSSAEFRRLNRRLLRNASTTAVSGKSLAFSARPCGFRLNRTARPPRTKLLRARERAADERRISLRPPLVSWVRQQTPEESS